MKSPLATLCEPIFQLVGDCFRPAPTGSISHPTRDKAALNSEFNKRFASLAEAATKQNILHLYNGVKPCLAYFVDHMVARSPLVFRGDWGSAMGTAQFLEAKDRTITGDTQFANRWNELLEPDRRATSREQLFVLFLCYRLGFRGADANRTQLEECEALSRVEVHDFYDHEVDRGFADDEHHVDPQTLYVVKTDQIVGVVTILATLGVIILLVYVVLYGMASSTLSSELDKILKP